MNDLSYCVDAKRLTRLGFEVRGSLERGIGDTVAMLMGTRSQHAAIPSSFSRKARPVD
jgi:hypothetical protein